MEEALKYFDSLNFYYHKVARTNLNDKDIVKFDQEQLVYVKVAFIALNFMCRKEEIIENKGNVEYELLVNNYELNKELNKIAERNNNGYIIGQIQFKDAAEVICYIRNKFAHGDYIINIYNNSVIMKKDGQNMEINIDKLINFIMPLSNLLDKIKNDKIYKRNLIGMPSPKNVGVIKNKEEYNNLLNKTNIFSLTFTKKNDDIFNQSEKIFIEQYISLIKNAVTNEKLYNSDALEKNFNENQSFARMKIEKHKINALEENSILEKLYDGNKKEFDEIELIPQMNQIAEWIDEIVVDDSMKNNLLSRGCLINSICCGSFKNGIISIKNCRQEYKNLTKFPLSNEETKRISALLAMFYAIYIYPNEHKYMNNFAYDKLNLDFLKPDTLEYKNVKLEQLKMRLS